MKRTAFFGIVTLFMLATLSAQAQTDGPRYLPSAADGACRQWVDSVFSRMSLHEKVGQLLVPKVMAEETKENKKAIKELVKKDKVGGLLFGVGTSEEQAILTNLAQSNAKVPLMITFDGEWGPAMRLKDVPPFPRNAALGCIADNGLIEAYGREVARQLRELGVVVNFAPVVDVNTNPLNPVIHVRSFGENPQQVAEKAVAYGRGLEAGGVLSVAKHFPGHGDTDSDSHKVLPVVWGDRHRLDSIELYPFKAMAGAGLGGVMVAHLQVPAVEPDSVLPSSLSHRVITGLLKEELGFEGLVFTDALDMKGVTGVSGYYTKAVLAGNDMLLVQFSAKEALNELVGAVRSGELPEALINEKCRKVLTYKYLLGLRGKQRKLQISGLSHRVNTEEARDLASRLRKASVTVLNNYFDVLPLATGRTKIAVLSMGGQEAEDSAFVSAMQQQGVADVYRLPWNADGNVRAKVREALMGYNRVVVSLAGFTYISDDNVAFLANLNLPAAMVYACFTSYRPLSLLTPALEKASAVVLAHSAEADVQAHVAQVLFGKAGANGRLSMSIGRLFPAGTGCDIVPGMKAGALVPDDYGMKSYVLQRIDQVALKGLQAGAYPGCRILVLKDGHAVYDKGFGVHSPVDSTRVRATDMFDLASLTKTTATLLAVMKLYDEGKLKLDDKASKYLSFLRGTNKRNVTIRELLLHESGLPPYIRFYVDAIDPHSVQGPYAQSWKDEWHQTQVSEHSYYCSDFKFKRGMMADKESATYTLPVAEGMWLNKSFKNHMLRAIAGARLEGKRYVYSDLGFILLQQVVEHITQLPMDLYLDKEFYAPMGLQRTLFLPLQRYTKADIMPTAFNDFLRRQDLCGYVHDEAAAFLGGVAGHAGLFSTAAEVARIYQMLLNGGELDGKRYLSEETCRLFTTEKSLISRRGLGFDRPDIAIVQRSPCAPSAPEGVYGHTGFTGTCVWVDPDSRTVYVFLSNRLCPDAWNTKLVDMDIRTDIQELVFESLKRE